MLDHSLDLKMVWSGGVHSLVVVGEVPIVVWYILSHGCGLVVEFGIVVLRLDDWQRRSLMLFRSLLPSPLQYRFVALSLGYCCGFVAFRVSYVFFGRQS